MTTFAFGSLRGSAAKTRSSRSPLALTGVLRPALLALCLAAAAQSHAERAVLRVGTSGDYAPFTVRDAGGARSGFDVELARAYARARKLRIRWVPLHWATLDRELAAGRFDVVMSGVTVRPERSLAGRFSVPVTVSGAILLSRQPALAPHARIAVNAGGHLERVARGLFPGARIEPRTPNAAVRDALVKGDVDAALTDTLEAPGWLAGSKGLHTLGPYTRDWKAYPLPAAAAERARDLDAWLLAREADGTLAALRKRLLPAAAQTRTAAPLPALAAAIDERLALMPLVAEAKRVRGEPVRNPAQEAAVLAAAPGGTRPLFAALIEAAREVQEHTLAGARGGQEAPDLDGALRPALARISERIGELAVHLPRDLDLATARSALAPVQTPGLTDGARERIAGALVDAARAAR